MAIYLIHLYLSIYMRLIYFFRFIYFLALFIDRVSLSNINDNTYMINKKKKKNMMYEYNDNIFFVHFSPPLLFKLYILHLYCIYLFFLIFLSFFVVYILIFIYIVCWGSSVLLVYHLEFMYWFTGSGFI